MQAVAGVCNYVKMEASTPSASSLCVIGRNLRLLKAVGRAQCCLVQA